MIGGLLARAATPLGARIAVGLVAGLLGIVVTLSVLLWINGNKLDSCREKKAKFAAAVAVQNQAIKDWKAEADARAVERDRAMDDARAAVAANAPQRERLRASAQQPRAPDGPCTISDALSETEGL